MYAESSARPSKSGYHNHHHQPPSLQYQIARASPKQPRHYTHEEIHCFDVIVYIPNPTQPRIWKIVLSEPIIQDVLKWYHVVLGHCRYQRLYNTVHARFHARLLKTKCRQFHCTGNCPTNIRTKEEDTESICQEKQARHLGTRLP